MFVREENGNAVATVRTMRTHRIAFWAIYRVRTGPDRRWGGRSLDLLRRVGHLILFANEHPNWRTSVLTRQG